MRSLPILDNLDDIRIASPCNARWDGMKAVADAEQGDRGARARFCGSCEKNVYDLSSMTRVDAMALIERHEGKCCVRFYKRTDGTVLTDDCPVGLRAAVRRAHLKALGGMASCAGAVAAVVAFLLGSANPISKRLGTFEAEHHAIAGGMMAAPPMPEPPMPEPPMPEPPMPEPMTTEPMTPTQAAPPTRQRKMMGKMARPVVVDAPHVEMGYVQLAD